MTFANSGATGISASSKPYTPRSNAKASTKRAAANRRAGTYTITKTGRFKRAAFVNALKGIKIHGDNYDKELDKWLRENQKVYGYKYSYIPKQAKGKGE